MRIIRLQFEGFRNLKDNYILPIDGINVIYGDNAQGKTNILESMWLFNGSRSFRGARDSELISFDKEFSKLSLMFYASEREQAAQILITPTKKEAVLNGVKKSYASELTGSFCSVIFSPDHLSLVKEGPLERRKFIDNAVVQIKPRYMQFLSQYTQTLNQRNALLKEIPYKKGLKETLPIWDEHLSKLGSMIINERLKYFEKLKNSASHFHSGLSGGSEELTMDYNFSFDYKGDNDTESIKNALYEALLKNREDDLQNKVTSCGPHRDDIDIKINGKKARVYASQGQQRSVVLSLKLAEADILKGAIGEKPVIFLDDVLSELDCSRQEYLLNNIKDWQVFITCCELASVGRLKSGKIFNVKNGVVKKQNG